MREERDSPQLVQMVTMIRLDQRQALKRQSAVRGESMAVIVRRGLDAVIERQFKEAT